MSNFPDFSSIAYKRHDSVPDKQAWEKALDQKAQKAVETSWLTNEQIPVKALYTADDIKDLGHLGFVSGVPPYLRGPYPTM